MNSTTKIVISMHHKLFCIELVFNILQRRVFADCKLDIYILTPTVKEVKEMAEHIEKCVFSNMNELIVTKEPQVAFKNAKYLLLMTDSSVHQREVVENLQNLTHVFDKAILFNRLADPNARVLVLGPQSSTWLQIFAEVATNLSKFNFTGLSRHHANKALTLVAQKLECDVQDLSDVYIWGGNYLSLLNGKKKTEFQPGQYGPQYETKEQNLIELLPVDWIDCCLIPQVTKSNSSRPCIISATCHHLRDWYQGTNNRIVCMSTIVLRPDEINDGIYSSYPVVVDENGHISVVHNMEKESLLHAKLFRLYEYQQKEKYRICHFLNVINTTKND